MERWSVAGGVLSLVIGAAACTGNDGSGVAAGGAAGSTVGGATATGGHPSTGGSGTTGGSSTSGGSGGSSTGTGGSGEAGGPPHVIGACDGLGAVGTFENITPTGVDATQNNGIVQLLVDPVNSGTIYAGTDHYGLRKSTDCGATWTKVNTGRHADILDSGILWSMALDPIDPQVIYAGSLYGSDASLLKSTNGGVDWDSLFPAGSEVAQTVDYNFFQDLSMDPTDHKHILVSFHANCKGAYAPMCMAETKDSGATWRLFKGPLNGWGEGAAPYTIGATTWLFRTVMNGLFYTSDSGATWENVGPGACPDGYRAKDGTYYLASVYGVLKSSDGHAWSKIDNSPNGYGIVGDGTRIFDSLRDSNTQQQPYFTAPENNTATWTTVASPQLAHGGVYLRYDTDHHVLYSVNTTSGLWRMVTQ